MLPIKKEVIEKRRILYNHYIERKGLIKHEDHYVPWEYQNSRSFWKNVSERRHPHEDIFAQLPKVSWCNKYKKWKIEFFSTDCSGYNVADFVWYFDKKKTLLKKMGLKNNEEEV